jgi:hypothetical protein
MAKTPAAAAPVQPKLVMKGTQEFRHDLFKSDVQQMLKNTAYTKGVVDVAKLEHTHIFHSVNSQGVPQHFSSTVGGHFHKLEPYMDAEGNLRLRCGPPIRNVMRKTPRGQKKTQAAVKWYDETGGRDGEGAWIVDEHTHDFAYLSSEMLSLEKLQAIRNQTKSAVASMTAQHVAQTVASQPAGTADGDGGGDGDGDAD